MRVTFWKITLTAVITLVQLGFQPQEAHARTIKSPKTETLDAQHPCREYLPEKGKPCTVVLDMSNTADGVSPPPVHADVAAWPGSTGDATVILQHSSPFAACVLTTAATPIARDSTAGVSSLLTTLGGIPQILAGANANFHGPPPPPPPSAGTIQVESAAW